MNNNQLTPVSRLVHSQDGRDSKPKYITPEAFLDAIRRLPSASIIEGNIQNYNEQSPKAHTTVRFNGLTSGGSLIYNYRTSSSGIQETIQLSGTEEQRRDIAIVLCAQNIELIDSENPR